MTEPTSKEVLDAGGYRYDSEGLSPSHDYLLPTVDNILGRLELPAEKRRIFELGCGNGSVAAHLTEMGYRVVGIDASKDGIRLASKAHPKIQLELGSCYDDLVGRFGRFPVLLSLEVVEHVFFPRRYAACIRDLLEPGGVAVISTPFHGYWKNLVLALSGRMDAHFTALWDYGHIKFWSESTLRTLLGEVGLSVLEVRRIGRVPALAKSMVFVVRRA
jgi:2-polyprenyl-3-methyl-5-hydroxy-6-metoxy-1,4-benzoquinol methylase